MKHIFLKIMLTVSCWMLCFSCGPRSGTHPANNVNKEKLPSNAPIDTIQVKALVDLYENGSNIFSKHCQRCHLRPEAFAWDANTFDNIFDRLPQPSEEHFVKYIQDSRALIDAGNSYAIALDRSNSSNFEHHYKDTLSEDQVADLISYIKVGVKLKHSK